MNELGGARADDMNAQQSPILAIEEQFQQPAVIVD